jgi:hypothetical protein
MDPNLHDKPSPHPVAAVHTGLAQAPAPQPPAVAAERAAGSDTPLSAPDPHKLCIRSTPLSLPDRTPSAQHTPAETHHHCNATYWSLQTHFPSFRHFRQSQVSVDQPILGKITKIGKSNFFVTVHDNHFTAAA